MSDSCFEVVLDDLRVRVIPIPPSDTEGLQFAKDCQNPFSAINSTPYEHRLISPASDKSEGGDVPNRAAKQYRLRASLPLAKSENMKRTKVEIVYNKLNIVIRMEKPFLIVIDEEVNHKGKLPIRVRRSWAASILANLNTSADPCTDFFQFACGGWIHNHPVPDTDSHWNQFNQVEERLTYQVKEILDAISTVEELQAVRDAKLFYRTCLKAESEENGTGLKRLIELLSQFGGWPMTYRHWKSRGFHWINMLAYLTRDLSLSPIVSVYAYVDRKDSIHSVLTVDQGGLSMPRSILIESTGYKKQKEAYKDWLFKTAELIGKTSGRIIPKDLLHLQVEELIHFEEKIAKITSPTEMRRNVIRTYNAMSLRDLQQWTDLAAPQQINWLIFVRKLMEGTNITIEWTEKVIVRELDYVFKVMQLLRDTPIKVLSNYMHWRLVKSLGPEVSPEIRHLSFQFEQIFTGATVEQPRWKECISSVTSTLGMAVGYSYVREHFDNTAKQVAEKMAEQIKKVLEKEMSELPWMDTETRRAAQYKVHHMSQLIGYPVWFHNTTALQEFYEGLNTTDNHWDNILSSRKFAGRRMFGKLREKIDRNEWPIPPAVVNAYYNPQANSIIFPAGILQPPFFKHKRPEVLNFGGIGVVIGHEITHGFDDVGRQSDSEGNLSQWWTEKTIESYEAIADCFISQYGKYRLPQLDVQLLRQVTVNGEMTQGENMADNGGLRLALLAYRNYIAETEPEPALPGLEQFTSEQLFFIAFATNWCESATKESLLQEILSDPHSPHKFRVEGSLANSADFSEAFNCPPPPKSQSCHIW